MPEPTGTSAPAPTSSAGSEAHEHEPAASGKPAKAKGAKETGNSLYDLAKRGEATLPATPAPTPTASTPVVPAPAPAAPNAPAPAPTPAPVRGKVTIPSTGHVQVDVPAGLQSALDLDPRMQPWANKVIQVIDDCYTQERKSNAGAAGVISVRITMHSESRPDADIKALPPALSGVVACATGGLMRTKMPLFTGNEGEKHNVNIRFTQ